MDTHVIPESTGFDRIVVPLDGSKLSESALPFASTIASSSHGTLALVRVHTPVVGLADVGFPAYDWEDEIRASENEYLTGVANTLAKGGTLRAETQLLDGPIGTAIKGFAEQSRASLIVMTTHGRTGLSRAWLGSTADWLARFSPVPVILVRPPEDEGAPPPTAAIQHVLVALDGSERAEKILPSAIRLGLLRGARFTLLRVVTPVFRGLSPYGSPGYPLVQDEAATMDLMRRAKDYLTELAARLRRDHGTLNMETEVVASEQAAAAIVERARGSGADIVALSTRGRGASRLLVGSVADKVLRRFSGVLLLLGPVAAKEVELEPVHAEEMEHAGGR